VNNISAINKKVFSVFYKDLRLTLKTISPLVLAQRYFWLSAERIFRRWYETVSVTNLLSRKRKK